MRFAGLLGEVYYFSQGNAIRYPEQAAFWNTMKEGLKNALDSVISTYTHSSSMNRSSASIMSQSNLLSHAESTPIDSSFDV